MSECHERLGPAHAVEAVGGQQVVGDEQRLEAELLGAHREPADLISVPLLRTGQQVRRQEHPQLQGATIVWWLSRWLRASGCRAPAARSMTTPRAAVSCTRRVARRLGLACRTRRCMSWRTRSPM